MPKIAGVNHLDAVRAFEKEGFQVKRQGKHVGGTELLTHFFDNQSLWVIVF